MARKRALVGTGIESEVKKNLTVDASYTGQLGSDASQFDLNLDASDSSPRPRRTAPRTGRRPFPFRGAVGRSVMGHREPAPQLAEYRYGLI